MKLPTRDLQVEELSSNPEVQRKQKELKEVNEKIDIYKKEIDNMKLQLQESYNLRKVTMLEDEQKHKRKILEDLQRENRILAKV